MPSLAELTVCFPSACLARTRADEQGLWPAPAGVPALVLDTDWVLCCQGVGDEPAMRGPRAARAQAVSLLRDTVLTLLSL